MLILDLSIKYEVYEIQNYRPLSILSNFSKVYEKCQFNEMVTHFDDILSKYQCGFRKGFSTQQFLIVLVENWKKNRNKRMQFCGNLSRFVKCIWLPFTWFAHFKITCSWSWHGFTKINLYLPVWRETEGQNKW